MTSAAAAVTRWLARNLAFCTLPPNGLELREQGPRAMQGAALRVSCLATVASLSRTLAGKARCHFPHASWVSCEDATSRAPRFWMP